MPTLPRLDRVSDTECGHSDDSAGEKEAKRQRSEPTTPVSTSGRLPYDYDAVMGITKVGTKEVEGFGEELDTSEYHDAAEEPSRKDESDDTVEPQRLSDFQGGYGSSSLKECIELLTATTRNTPAPLDSGDGQKPVAPPQFFPIFGRFFQFLGDFFPIFPVRLKGHFRAIFFRFRAEARNRFSLRSARSHAYCFLLGIKIFEGNRELVRTKFSSLRIPLRSHYHRVLQGAAQRGAQFYFIFTVLRTLFSWRDATQRRVWEVLS